MSYIKIIFELIMGILQSCQGGDPRISIEIDRSFLRTQNNYRLTSKDFEFQFSKLKLFGDIFYKKFPSMTQFILQTNLTNRNSQVVSHSLHIYTQSASFIHDKGSKIKIVNGIDDPNLPKNNHKLHTIKFLQKTNTEYLLKTIPFNRYQEETFKKGIYELYMLHQARRDEPNKYSFSYHDAYVIQSGIDKDKNDKCLVIVGDAVAVTLHQMIEYRKLTQAPWGKNQYETLCYQLIRSLAQLHQSKIAHRDIRPHNIFYSPLKKAYIIGGMENSVNLKNTSIGQGLGMNLSGVPYYMPRVLASLGSKQDYSQYYNYNPYQIDTYALGLSLLNALFLDSFLPAEVLICSIDKYIEHYPFVSFIKSMVSENPPSLVDMIRRIGEPTNLDLIEDSNVQALRYRLKPQDQEFVGRKKGIADGYYQMFMYDQWVQEINEVVNYYELNNDNIQLGQIYKQIADIYAEHHQQQMMEEYYGRACKIFIKISQQCMDQKKNEESIRYLEKGIQCNRKGYKDTPNMDLASLLNKLSLAHHSKAEYEVARAFQQEALEITSKVKGDNSAEYAEMLVDSAKIESQFQEFKQAENMLKAGIKVIERKQENNQNLRIKSRLLQCLGSNFRMKAIQRRDKCDVYRKKAEESLLDALEITERIQGSIHPQVGSILLNLGNVYFDRREFEKAKKSYQRALMIKQHTMKGRINVQVGECLTYLANSQKFLKEYEMAIRHYDEAIEVFRKAYGNDHNQNTAVAIGNLGLVYKQIGKKQQQRQYLSLAKTILKDLYGEQCPDYQYFDRQMSK